jgi:hypothetical protein
MRQSPVTIFSLSGLILAGALCATATAAEWGDLKAKFVYGGTPPQAAPVNVTKDQAYCGKFNLVDESLVVNKDNRGLQNVVVYISPRPGAKGPDVHPSYTEAATEPLRLDNMGCRFSPRVVAIQAQRKLILGNKDQVAHNTKVDTFSSPAINPLLPAGAEITHQFAKAERRPAAVSCSIHPWMAGWVVVLDHPYGAVSDANGDLEIKNIPAGKWTFQFWQEKAGYVSDVKQGGKATKWDRGRVDLTIKAGMNDLGTIEVNPSLFK